MSGPFYRIRWHKGINDFEIMIKFKYSDLMKAKDKCIELAAFEPYIAKDKNFRGRLSYTVYINKHEKIWLFCNMKGWKDDRPEQQRRMTLIKEFIQSRLSEIGIVSKKIKKEEGVGNPCL